MSLVYAVEEYVTLHPWELIRGVKAIQACNVAFSMFLNSRDSSLILRPAVVTATRQVTTQAKIR